jgi:hypothetical protein
MDPLLTWDDLAPRIGNMSPEDRAKPVLLQSSTTGAFFGVTGIGRTHEEDNPPGLPFLVDDNNWYSLDKDGKPQRGRYQPSENEAEADDRETDFVIDRQYFGQSKFYAKTDAARRFMQDWPSAKPGGDHYLVHEKQVDSALDDIENHGMSWK